MPNQRIEPVFVEFIPEVITPGKLYISIRFRTASHLCACGCGLKVVTPIKPAKWRFSYDGETVTLSPSVGRWQLPCKSHYCIVKNDIVWARRFSDDEMVAVQKRDAQDTRAYYARRADTDIEPDARAEPADRDRAPLARNIWTKIRRCLHLR